MQINDPPTAAQIAVLVERVLNIAGDMQEVRDSQKRIEHVIVDVPLLKKELEHISDAVRQQGVISESRGAAMHQIDKRVLVLERWHKYRVAQTGIAITMSIAAFSYGAGFLKSLSDFRDETKSRIQSLEFIVNSPSYERAMQPPVAAGKK